MESTSSTDSVHLLRKRVSELEKSVRDLKNIESESRFDLSERKKAERDLIERRKELNCLFKIMTIYRNNKINLDEMYQAIVNVIPLAWQYPEITCCKVTLNDKEYKTSNYISGKWGQSAEIKQNSTTIGEVQINYIKDVPLAKEGAFLERGTRPD